MYRQFRHFSVAFGAIGLLAMFVGCNNNATTPPKTTSTAKTAVTDRVPEAESTSVKPDVIQSDERAEFEIEPGFSFLNRDQFESFAAEPDTWQPTADGIRCTGKPRGYLYSKQSYRNFVLRLEYRFPRPDSLKDDAKFKGNTGFLVYVTGEHKLWPTCIEVQGKHVQMAAIKENGGAEPVVTEDDDAARKKSRKSVGEWNALEIISKDGSLIVNLNGTRISNSQAGPLQEGLIGIQAEDHPFEVRRLRISAENELSKQR